MKSKKPTMFEAAKKVMGDYGRFDSKTDYLSSKG